jgi:hypothetical protein
MQNPLPPLVFSKFIPDKIPSNPSQPLANIPLRVKRILFSPGNQKHLLSQIVYPVRGNSQRSHERTQLLMLLSNQLREFGRNRSFVTCHIITLSRNPEV